MKFDLCQCLNSIKLRIGEGQFGITSTPTDPSAYSSSTIIMVVMLLIILTLAFKKSATLKEQ